MSRVRVGCIGLGRMGSIFTRHLARHVPEAELVAVADPVPGLAERTAQEYGVPRWFEDYRTLFTAGVAGVIVATPASTHAEVIEAAVQAGSAIFCEKPLALTLADCDRAMKAVGRACTSRSGSIADSMLHTCGQNALSTRVPSAARSPSSLFRAIR